DVGAGPTEVEVPNLIGLDRVAAQASLQQAGLVLSPDQKQEVVQDDKDVGHVQAQDPTAGHRLTKGKSVTITVGVAPETIGVPDVTGTNIEQAQRNITVAHLTPQVQEVDSTVERGRVLKQSPAGGTNVKARSTVTLTVSRGNLLQMPNLHGLTPNQAQATLQKLGWAGTLKQTTTQVNDTNQAGVLVAQDMPPRTRVTPDHTITITIGQNTTTTTPTTTSPIFSTPGFGGGG